MVYLFEPLVISSALMRLRACFKIPWGPVFGEKAGWRGVTSEHTRQRSVSEEQRSQPVFCAKTLRAAGLLSAACVGSAVIPTCREGDAPAAARGYVGQAGLAALAAAKIPRRRTARNLKTGSKGSSMISVG